MQAEPFFERRNGALVPTSWADGFWGPAANLHARVVIGLLAHEIERRHRAEGFMPARLTVDLYRMPDLSPVEVTTRVVRQGGRICLIEADFLSGGKASARAVCQLLRRTEQPEGDVWRAPRWDAPGPDEAPPPDMAFVRGKWEMRPLPQTAPGAGPRRAWMRELRQLIGGEDYTPFVRVATGVDYVSPLVHAAAQGLSFINSDVTLYLQREPAGEWIGYAAEDHQSAAGIAVGHCTLYDIHGEIGFAACAALAQRRAAD